MSPALREPATLHPVTRQQVLLGYWSALQWAPPTGNWRWGTTGEVIQSRALSALRQPASAGGWARGPGNSPGPWRAPPAVAQASGQQWASPHPCLCGLTAVTVCPAHSLWDLVSPFGWLEETGSQLRWMPGSLRDDGGAGCGSLALKELPAEICLLSARTGALEAEHCALELCPFV